MIHKPDKVVKTTPPEGDVDLQINMLSFPKDLQKKWDKLPYIAKRKIYEFTMECVEIAKQKNA